MDLMMAKLFDVKSGGTTTTVADTETEQLINELTKATFTAAAEAAAIKSTTASPPIDPDDICGHTSMYNPVVIASRKYVAGVLVAGTALIGLIGNLLSLITLTSMPRRNLFNKLILTLTVFDTLFLLCGGSFMVQQAFSFQNTAYNILFPHVIYPLAGLSMTGSTYTCIAIAFERYLGMIRAQSDSSLQHRKSRYYIISIVAIIILIDAPRFLEMQPILDDDGNVKAFVYTEIRRNKTYIQVYTLWFRLIATAALPFILMLFFNLRILKYYRENSSLIINRAEREATVRRNSPNNSQSQSQQDSAQIRNHVASPPPAVLSPNRGSVENGNSGAGSSNSSSQDRTLYITFLCLTTTFLLCHAPRIIINVYEVPMSGWHEICDQQFHRRFYQPSWVIVLSCFEKFTLILNSSINFVYYCLAGKAFRQHMCKVIFKKVIRVCQRVSVVIGSDPAPGSAGYNPVNSGNREANDPDRIDPVSATVDNTRTTGTGGTNTTSLLTSEVSATSASGAGIVPAGHKNVQKLVSIEEDVTGEPIHLDHDLQEQLKFIQASKQYPVVVVEPLPGDGFRSAAGVGVLASRSFFKSQPEIMAIPQPEEAGSTTCLYPATDVLQGMLTRSRSTNIPRRVSKEFTLQRTVTTVSRSTSPVNFETARSVSGSTGSLSSRGSTGSNCPHRYDSDSEEGDDDLCDSASYCSAGSNSSCGSSYDERCSKCLIMGKRETSGLGGGNAEEVFL